MLVMKLWWSGQWWWQCHWNGNWHYYSKSCDIDIVGNYCKFKWPVLMTIVNLLFNWYWWWWWCVWRWHWVQWWWECLRVTLVIVDGDLIIIGNCGWWVLNIDGYLPWWVVMSEWWPFLFFHCWFGNYLLLLLSYYSLSYMVYSSVGCDYWWW